MERTLMGDMLIWKDAPNRMPLLLEGARQVGKTWLMKEFGQKHFGNIAYVNLENNPVMEQVLKNYSDVYQVIKAIAALTHESISPNETLIILDEIQEIPFALSSLKYFCENAQEYAVMAAGSLLGVKFPKMPAPYPVGKVQTLKLYPLSFNEYLLAVGESQLVEALRSSDFALIKVLAPRFTRLLSDYYYIGGMPKAVSTFLEESDYRKVRSVQLQMISDFENDMSKHLNNAQASHAHSLWQAVATQLGREQGKRFVFSELSGSGRARDYKDALQWLIDAKLVTRVPRVSKPGIPLKAFANDGLFELFLLDVGLYSAMVELDIDSVLATNPLFLEGKGALSEQFVCQQLLSELNATPYYWASNKTPAQLDFLVSHEGTIYPIEVKAAENLRSKSLRSFSERYALHGYRFSLAAYESQDWMTNIPLYAASTLFSHNPRRVPSDSESTS